MPAWTAPKGPLPARVYWFRRLLVLSTVFLLVFAAARLFGGDGDQGGAGERAVTAGAEASPSAEAVPERAAAEEGVPEEGATPGRGKGGSQEETATAEPTPEATPEPPPLPEPTGPCVNSDVVITPVVGAPRADGQVDMVLVLRTQATPACTWQVSADTVAIKISSGDDAYWFSSHCPAALPAQDVVLYQGTDTTVPFVWSGRRSDPECSRRTAWAMPGYYHVTAAAFEGEPTQVQFQRTAASITATRTAEPQQAGQGEKPKKKNKKNKKKRNAPAPSGAVEPTPRD